MTFSRYMIVFFVIFFLIVECQSSTYLFVQIHSVNGLDTKQSSSYLLHGRSCPLIWRWIPSFVCPNLSCLRTNLLNSPCTQPLVFEFSSQTFRGGREPRSMWRRWGPLSIGWKSCLRKGNCLLIGDPLTIISLYNRGDWSNPRNSVDNSLSCTHTICVQRRSGQSENAHGHEGPSRSLSIHGMARCMCDINL